MVLLPEVLSGRRSHVLGVVAVSVHAEATDERVEVGALVGREGESGGGGVLPDPRRAAGAGGDGGDDPGMLCEQPSERDLSGCRPFRLGEGLHVVYERLIGREVLGLEARNAAADVALRERRARVDGAGEEPPSRAD